jgi:hydroxypyruvate isomerase
VQTSGQAAQIIEEVGADGLYLQLDVYHTHIMEGDAVAAIQRSSRHIAHVQVADDPGRHQPGTGTIDYASVFCALESVGYREWVGCEYLPLGATEDSLTWMNAYSSWPPSRSEGSRPRSAQMQIEPLG